MLSSVIADDFKLFVPSLFLYFHLFPQVLPWALINLVAITMSPCHWLLIGWFSQTHNWLPCAFLLLCISSPSCSDDLLATCRILFHISYLYSLPFHMWSELTIDGITGVVTHAIAHIYLSNNIQDPSRQAGVCASSPFPQYLKLNPLRLLLLSSQMCYGRGPRCTGGHLHKALQASPTHRAD